MASLRLTESDFKHAAELLGVEVAAIKAVLEVETGNKGGFLAVGKPTILNIVTGKQIGRAHV